MTVSGIFTVMVTMRKTERERPGAHAGAQMSSLLKQGFPRYHVSVAHAMTQSSKNKTGEGRGANRACRETPLLKENTVHDSS